LPFKCRWKQEFNASGIESFGDFVRTLTPAQIAECRYHATDWMTAARVAVELVEAGATDDDIDAAAEAHDPCTGYAIASFWAEPIFVDGRRLGNGQHRVCAMKLAGVPQCPIED
jgi:hypothetical protein